MPTKTRAIPAERVARSGASGTAAAIHPPELASVLAKLETTQDELNAFYPQLERLNRLAAMGTIAGMIAHEFNNILTPMLSYAQMASANPGDLDLAQKAIQRTIAGSERAAKIADAILSFARDEDQAADGSVFHVEPTPANAPLGGSGTDVAQVVEDAIACMARSPSREGIDLRLDIPPSIHAAIQPIALQQVLVNLIQNAQNAMNSQQERSGSSRAGAAGGMLSIRACHSKYPPLTPPDAADSRQGEHDRSPFTKASSASCSTWNSTTPDSHSRGWVSITVQDSGRGIAPDHLASLFTPFRSRSSGATRGTGLGMIIIKRLVERAGGWLTVESSLGHGTTATIILASL